MEPPTEDAGGGRARESARRSLRAVFGATFCVRFSFGITLAVFASYVTGRSAGLSAADYGVAGIVAALAPAGEALTVLFSGAAADRWGRFPVLFAGMGGAAVLFLVVAATRDVAVLGAANFLFGVASGAILASSLAVVADRSGRRERGLEMGRFDAMNLSGWVAGYAFGFGAWGLLPNDRLGLLFVAGAAGLAVGIAAAALLARGVPRGGRRQGFSVVGAVRDAFRAPVLVVTVPWTAIYGLIGTALYFLGVAANGIGIRPLELAIAIGIAGGLFVLTQPSYGRLADRLGRTALMTIGAGGFVSVMLFAALLLLWGAAWPLLAGIAGSALLALAYGPAALAALTDLTAEMSRATTMAVYSLTISVGMFFGIFASSVLFDRFGDPGIDAFFAALATVLVAFTVQRHREARRATIPAR